MGAPPGAPISAQHAMALDIGATIVALKQNPRYFLGGRANKILADGRQQSGDTIGKVQDPTLVEGDNAQGDPNGRFYYVCIPERGNFVQWLESVDENIEWCDIRQYQIILKQNATKEKLSSLPTVQMPTITASSGPNGENDYKLVFDTGWSVLWSDFAGMSAATILTNYNSARTIPKLSEEEERKKAEEEAAKNGKTLLTTTNILLAVLASGLLGTLLYLALKNRKQRQRPY